MNYLKHFESDEKVLKEKFNFLNLKEATDFIKKACNIFEDLNHHPDYFCLKGKKIEIHLSTHTESKVTNKDHKVIEKLIDSISDCCKPLNPHLFKNEKPKS